MIAHFFFLMVFCQLQFIQKLFNSPSQISKKFSKPKFTIYNVNQGEHTVDRAETISILMKKVMRPWNRRTQVCQVCQVTGSNRGVTKLQ